MRGRSVPMHTGGQAEDVQRGGQQAGHGNERRQRPDRQGQGQGCPRGIAGLATLTAVGVADRRLSKGGLVMLASGFGHSRDFRCGHSHRHGHGHTG